MYTHIDEDYICNFTQFPLHIFIHKKDNILQKKKKKRYNLASRKLMLGQR